MKHVAAILWDYDSTLVDSVRKNMEVIAAVLSHFDPDIYSHLPRAVTDYEYFLKVNQEYKNWHELYINEFGVREDQLGEAGVLWGPEQMKTDTVPDLFSGMAELLKELDSVPMGICSQNDRKNILSVLEYYGIEGCFDVVLGCTDVTGKAQKPDPEGFLKAAEILKEKGAAPGDDDIYVYIGDHRDDVTFGKNAGKELKVPVFCISFDAQKLNEKEYREWDPPADAYVQNVKELKDVLLNLING